MRPNKTIEDSKTEQVHLLRYEDINGEGRLFGGKLVSWIDEVAGTTAKRHAETRATTASIDNLVFKNAAFLDELVVISGRSPTWEIPLWRCGWIPMWRNSAVSGGRSTAPILRWCPSTRTGNQRRSAMESR